MSKIGEIAGKCVHTSRTLVPPRSRNVSLRVMNLRDVAVRLHKGATVAELQPMGVVEIAAPPSEDERQQECVRELIRATDHRLSTADRNKLSSRLNEFRDTLSVDEYDMGQTGIIEHHIYTGHIHLSVKHCADIHHLICKRFASKLN